MSYEQMDEKALMLGGHEARIDALESGMKAANEKLDAILAKVNETRGGWKMITLFGGTIVGLVEIIEAVKGALHFK